MVAVQAFISSESNEFRIIGSLKTGAEVHREQTSDLFYKLLANLQSTMHSLQQRRILRTGRKLHPRNESNTCLSIQRLKIIQQIVMLRGKQYQIEQKPRKKVKRNRVIGQQFDEFKGQAICDEKEKEISTTQIAYQAKLINQQRMSEEVKPCKEIEKYESIFKEIKNNPREYIKLAETPQPGAVTKQVKVQQAIEKKDEKKKETGSSKKKEEISSNWKKFLQLKKDSLSKPSSEAIKGGKNNYDFVAIDCQFVKSGDHQCLARVSLVNEKGEQIYDSYVKPSKKITDYVTEISGITYAHIKNAPDEQTVINELKKRMLNKIIIGHTLSKDLYVCGLNNWSGFKKMIDISEASMYSKGGKRKSLKSLTYSYIGKVIQQGWHSSLEDAQATMQLFLKNRNQILKEQNIIKKR